MSKVKSIIILIVTAIFVGFFGFASFVSGPVPNSVKNYKSIFGAISKGIDLAGGYYAVLEPKSDADISDSEMSSIMETIRKRLTDNGFTEASVEKQNSTSIRVEIPEVKNPDDVLKYVGSQGKLEFRDSAGTVWLTGADITKAAAGYDSDGKPAVNLEFTAQGQKKFKNATAAVSASSDKKLYIYLGDEQVSAPTCNEEINSKSAQIQLNGGSAEEAKSLASVITSGSLEVDLKMVESGAMSATLGKNALNNAMRYDSYIRFAYLFLRRNGYRGVYRASRIRSFIRRRTCRFPLRTIDFPRYRGYYSFDRYGSRRERSYIRSR